MLDGVAEVDVAVVKELEVKEPDNVEVIEDAVEVEVEVEPEVFWYKDKRLPAPQYSVALPPQSIEQSLLDARIEPVDKEFAP